MWWIRASIQEYILRSWSLVKMGTTAAQKKLFFNLRKAKSRDQRPGGGRPAPRARATRSPPSSACTDDEVISMNRRLSGAGRLAERAAALGQRERVAGLAGRRQGAVSQETVLAESEEHSMRMGLLEEAMKELTDRERHILTERRLKETRPRSRSWPASTASAASACARSRSAPSRSCRRRCARRPPSAT